MVRAETPLSKLYQSQDTKMGLLQLFAQRSTLLWYALPQCQVRHAAKNRHTYFAFCDESALNGLLKTVKVFTRTTVKCGVKNDFQA